MKCPFCSNPAYEGIDVCRQCGFSLERLDQVYGAVPRLPSEISDLAGIFSSAESGRLRTLLSRFHKRFPQGHMHIVTADLRPDENLPAYAFWIFNRGWLSRDLDRGSVNHDVMLMIDAANGRTSIMIGYGLEPFVGADHLQEAIDAGQAAFAAGKHFDATVKIVEQTSTILARIASGLDRTYGINIEEIHAKEQETAAARSSSPGADDSPY